MGMPWTPKLWYLSWIDFEGLKKWDADPAAIEHTLCRTHVAHAPWPVIHVPVVITPTKYRHW